MVVVYDTQFDVNEYFIFTALFIGVFLFIKFKKIFTAKETILLLIFPVFIGMLLDHTISIPPFDFYDVNDNSSFEVMDFLTYLMYGPFGYLFIYFIKQYKIRDLYLPLYILFWAVLSITVEFVANQLGVFHYKNGYQIFFSFPIYLLVLSLKIFFYKQLRLRGFCKDSQPSSTAQFK